MWHTTFSKKYLVTTNSSKYTYTERWELEPQNEDGLEREVPWEVVQHNPEREALHKVEESKYDPVCQPLNVILLSGALNSFEREVGGETPTDEVGDG